MLQGVTHFCDTTNHPIAVIPDSRNTDNAWVEEVVVITVCTQHGVLHQSSTVALASATPERLGIDPSYDGLLSRVERSCERVRTLASKLVSQLLAPAVSHAAFMQDRGMDLRLAQPAATTLRYSLDQEAGPAQPGPTFADGLPTPPPAVLPEPHDAPTIAVSITFIPPQLPLDEPIDAVDEPLTLPTLVAVQPRLAAAAPTKAAAPNQPRRASLAPGRLIPETASPAHALATVKPRPIRVNGVAAPADAPPGTAYPA